MNEEKSESVSRVNVTFEVNLRPGANAEEALALQQHLYEFARTTSATGDIEGHNWTREDGALVIVYTFQSKVDM